MATGWVSEGCGFASQPWRHLQATFDINLPLNTHRKIIKRFLTRKKASLLNTAAKTNMAQSKGKN